MILKRPGRIVNRRHSDERGYPMTRNWSRKTGESRKKNADSVFIGWRVVDVI
jgi:hypothetical protein